MSDFLQLMAQGSHQRLQLARGRHSEQQLLSRIADMPDVPPLVYHPGGFDIIAELKLVSPAVGRLKPEQDDVAARINAYARGGAAAISVLTEPGRFGGSLAHVQQASEALAGTPIPVMRKDFLVDPYQVLEARAAGAGGVLVILAMLDDPVCRALVDTAREHNMFVLLEAFDVGELDRAGELLACLPYSDQLLLGLNCRDLRSLQVDPGRFEAVVADFPVGPPRVAESGIETPDQARRIRELGYDLALVGTALMRSGQPEQTLVDLLAAGRAGVRAAQ